MDKDTTRAQAETGLEKHNRWSVDQSVYNGLSLHRSVCWSVRRTERSPLLSIYPPIDEPRERERDKPQNVLHSHLCTSCASNFRRTDRILKIPVTVEIHMEDRNHGLA